VWLEFAAWERDVSVGIVAEDLRRYYRVRAAKGYCGGRKRVVDTRWHRPMTAMERKALRPKMAV